MSEQKYKKKNRIGNRLNKLLKEKEISVDQLSMEIGVSRSVLFDYIKERKNPSEQTLDKIADYFNVPKEYLTNNFYYYDENLFIYISKLREDLIEGLHTKNSNQLKLKKRYEKIKKQYIDLFEGLYNYFKYDYLKTFYTIIMKGLFMYMNGYPAPLEAEIIPYNHEHISELLHVAIKASDLTVKEVSKLCGVERSLIQNYISGRLNPSDKTLEKITNGLNLPEKFFTADSRNGVILFGDSYLYSPLPKFEKEVIPTNFNEQTNRKFDNIYSDYWKIVDKLFSEMSQESKKQIINFLDESFQKFKKDHHLFFSTLNRTTTFR